MKYIQKDITDDNIVMNIQKIIGKTRHIGIRYKDGKITELEIDDLGLSPTKKTQLQIYVNTLKNE